MSARVHADCDIASALAARAMRARLRDGFEHDRGALGFTRRPGADGNRRGGGFRGFGGGRELLDLFAGGTFTRSTEGSYLTAADALAWAGVNERRLEYDASLPGGRGLLLEVSRTNELLRSRELTDAAWTAGTGTTTADQATSPDSTTSAERVNVASGQFSPYQTLAGTGIKTLSAWVRAVAGSVSHQMYIPDGGGALANFASIGATWTRRDLTKTVVTGPASAVCCDGRDLTASGGQVATAQDIYADLIQFEPGAFPTSAIRTTAAAVTRGADVLSYAVGQYPASFPTRGFRFRFVPRYTRAEMIAAGQGAWLVSLAGGAGTDALQWTFGGGVGQLYLYDTETHAGGTLVATGLNWSGRDTVVTVDVQPELGKIVLSGLTAGDGTYSPAAWGWPSGTLHVGSHEGTQGASNCIRYGQYMEAL